MRHIKLPNNASDKGSAREKNETIRGSVDRAVGKRRRQLLDSSMKRSRLRFDQSFVVRQTMDRDDERQLYGDASRLEPIAEQQDDEVSSSRRTATGDLFHFDRTSSIDKTATSPTSSFSLDTSFIEEERRVREETQQFEELEKECASHRRGVRVKFDDEQLVPISRTTVIKDEPCFQVISNEDQVTKHFYHNERQPDKDSGDPSSKPNLSRALSEQDSLEEQQEEEYVITFRQENDDSRTRGDAARSTHNDTANIPYEETSNSKPSKSILKSAHSKAPVSTTKSERPSNSRSSSPHSTIQKNGSMVPSESNEIQHLAELTAKEMQALPALPLRSLFEPTVNIFDSSSSSRLVSNPDGAGRLKYYVKPYRGDASAPPDLNKHRSRSLLEQRTLQQSRPVVWHTFSSQYNRPLSGQQSRKQHVSWSPVREYIHDGRGHNAKSSTGKAGASSVKCSSLLSAQSSSNPCLQSASSTTPGSVRCRSSHSPKARQRFRGAHPTTSIGSREVPSIANCSQMPATLTLQCDQYGSARDKALLSSLPDITHQHRQEHGDTMQRYDRLLEKMRATDEQLQSLSRSWSNSTTYTRAPTKTSSELDSSSRTETHENKRAAPTTFQTCLLILVIMNLVFIYFFNRISKWWNRSVAHTTTSNQYAGATFKY